MVHVDVIAHPELLPRLKLLATHLERSGIALELHSPEANLDGAERVIVAPPRDEAPTPPRNARQVIALYLEPQTPPLTADHEIHIETWPARSSDRDVYRLAALLRRTLPAPSTDSRRATASPWPNRMAGAVLTILIGAGFWYLTTLEPDDRSNRSSDGTGDAIVAEAVEPRSAADSPRDAAISASDQALADPDVDADTDTKATQDRAIAAASSGSNGNPARGKVSEHNSGKDSTSSSGQERGHGGADSRNELTAEVLTDGVPDASPAKNPAASRAVAEAITPTQVSYPRRGPYCAFDRLRPSPIGQAGTQASGASQPHSLRREITSR